MVITNLKRHSSSAVDFPEFYSADLNDNGKIIPVVFYQSYSGQWSARSLKTDVLCPIKSVGGGKTDITTWRDQDQIVLDGAIHRTDNI